jgi:hypothetical protein
MKKMRLYFFLLLVILIQNACNNELVTVEKGKSVPIVYGFLDISDTATYIRVERTFIDETRGAPQIAQIADSLYYPNAIVSLVNTKNNRKFNLVRVDGNTEGYVRDTGFFANKPNYLYKIKTSSLELEAGQSWRLEVRLGAEQKPIAEATTKVIGTYKFLSPEGAIALDGNNKFNIVLETEEKTGLFYDADVTVNYEETDASGSKKDKSVVWQFLRNAPRLNSGNEPAPEIRLNRLGAEFYSFMATNIPVLDGGSRKFKSFDVLVWSSGPEFSAFRNRNLANIGITGSQEFPPYTNVTGGLGVFAARYNISKKGAILNDASLNLLKVGDLTKKLNFR